VFKVKEGLLTFRDTISFLLTECSFLTSCVYIRSSSKSIVIAYFLLSFKVSSSLRSLLSSLRGLVILVNLA
jgi:hypothetical protein